MASAVASHSSSFRFMALTVMIAHAAFGLTALFMIYCNVETDIATSFLNKNKKIKENFA
jgi:hypothetical protein